MHCNGSAVVVLFHEIALGFGCVFLKSNNCLCLKKKVEQSDLVSEYSVCLHHEIMKPSLTHSGEYVLW